MMGDREIRRRGYQEMIRQGQYLMTGRGFWNNLPIIEGSTIGVKLPALKGGASR
jgi:hypothetical protein